MAKQVGIDAIAVHVPRLFIDLQGEWAQVRAAELGEPSVDALVGKVTRGLGAYQMSVPDAHEDSATMAAMAAKKVIDAAGIDPRDIDYLAVGTETTVDQSKSIAAYVLGMLESAYGIELPDVTTPQIQFACIGATFALEAAVNRIRAEENRKPYALVIATDISRYPLRSPGEYTQGAGAVAMLIKEQPRLLIVEPGLMSVVTRSDRDFFRPNWSATAVVDGKYSIGVYLDCIEAAWQRWTERFAAVHGINSVRRQDELLDYLLFHVPFPRMAEYAAARIFGSSWLKDAAQRQRIAAELPLTNDLSGNDNARVRSAWERELAKTPIFQEAYAQKVEPSLHFARRVGNIYSGSLYGALANLLASASKANIDIAGKRIGFFSYGSGASGAVFSAIVAPSYRESPVNIEEELAEQSDGGRRVSIDLAAYEALHNHREARFDINATIQDKLDNGEALSAAETQELASVLKGQVLRISQPATSASAPSNEFALVRLGSNVGPKDIDLGYRYYEWVPSTTTPAVEEEYRDVNFELEPVVQIG